MKAEFSPLVSIVIPVYNGSRYMREAIDSALNQTYKNIEVIVINDGSTDDTNEIAKSYGDRIRYFKKENGGVASALNLAIKKAKGDYISWLSHDDVYFPEKLEIQIDNLKKISDKNTILYGNWLNINDKSEPLFTELLQDRFQEEKLNISLYPLINGIFNGCTVLIRKLILIEFGLFDIDLKTTQDYDLFFKILRKYPVKFIKNNLIKSRDHVEMGSKSLSNIHTRESERLWRKIIGELTDTEILGMTDSRMEFFVNLSKRLMLIKCEESAVIALKEGFKNKNHKKNVLFLTANLKGGLGRYSQELTSTLQNYNIFLLIINNGHQLVLRYGETELLRFDLGRGVKFENMFTPSTIDLILEKILPALEIQIVHINGFLAFGFNILKTFKKYNLPVVYTAHDFQLVCLSQHLINNKGQYCGICKYGEEAVNCLESNYYSKMFGKLNDKKLHEYRNYIKDEVLKKIDYYVFPSNYCEATLENFYPEIKKIKSERIPHGIQGIDKKEPRIRKSKKVEIGIIGNLGIHKGIEIIEKLTATLPDNKFHFTFFGKVDEKTKLRNTTLKGEYQYGEIISKLRESPIDVMLILSESPETFSYTISESIEAGIPVITSNVGAQGERVKKYEAGWVFEPVGLFEKTKELLFDIYSNRQILKNKQISVSRVKLEEVEEMRKKYSSIYETLIIKKKAIYNEAEKNIEWILQKEINLHDSAVLQISDTDLTGNKFNGHDLHHHLNNRGIKSRQLVWTKNSDDINTLEIARNRLNRQEVFYLSQRIQKQYSLNSLANPLIFDILYDPAFLNTKLVHLHLIHNHIFDIQLLPMLSKLKPIVWTLHDPWALSGHCVEHSDCNKWEKVCFDCPYLDAPFKLEKDNSTLNFELKKAAIAASNLEIIVASKYMHQKVKNSPIFKNKNVHLIPFGIDLSIFKKTSKQDAKKKLNIPEKAFVISFRSDNRGKKGIEYIEYVISKLKTNKDIYFISFGGGEFLKNEKFHFIELGWVTNDLLMADIYNASDLFLMPSTLESFGMMAMEAMCCGTLPIVLDGTALPDTVNAPICGVSTARDKEKYYKAVQFYIEKGKERKEREKKCLEYAKINYNLEQYLQKMIKVYEKTSERFNLTERNRLLLEQLAKTHQSEYKNDFKFVETEKEEVSLMKTSIVKSINNKARSVIKKVALNVSPAYKVSVENRNLLNALNDKIEKIEKNKK